MFFYYFIISFVTDFIYYFPAYVALRLICFLTKNSLDPTSCMTGIVLIMTLDSLNYTRLILKKEKAHAKNPVS